MKNKKVLKKGRRFRDAPGWFNLRGTVVKFSSVSESSTITFHSPNNYSMLVISRTKNNNIYNWRVEWKKRKWVNQKDDSRDIHGPRVENEVFGTVFLTDGDLRDAFALGKNSETTSDIMYATPCVFARVKRFLNIPCTGTGMDGDPNMSLYISGNVQRAVRQLMKKAKRKK